MRRFLLVPIVFTALLCGSACTPAQVAMVLHRDVKTVTPQLVEKATHAYDQIQFDIQQRHNEPFLTCTRGHESDTAGGYLAYNSGGPYYGAYQFLQSTWDKTAAHALRWDLVGKDPRTVSWWDQDYIAWTLYQWQGKAPWNMRC